MFAALRYIISTNKKLPIRLTSLLDAFTPTIEGLIWLIIGNAYIVIVSVCIFYSISNPETGIKFVSITKMLLAGSWLLGNNQPFIVNDVSADTL